MTDRSKAEQDVIARVIALMDELDPTWRDDLAVYKLVNRRIVYACAFARAWVNPAPPDA